MIKILTSLHRNQLPRELFNDAARHLLSHESLDTTNLPKLQLLERIDVGDNYTKMLYTMAARIRLYQGLN